MRQHYLPSPSLDQWGVKNEIPPPLTYPWNPFLRTPARTVPPDGVLGGLPKLPSPHTVSPVVMALRDIAVRSLYPAPPPPHFPLVTQTSTKTRSFTTFLLIHTFPTGSSTSQGMMRSPIVPLGRFPYTSWTRLCARPWSSMGHSLALDLHARLVAGTRGLVGTSLHLCIIILF